MKKVLVTGGAGFVGSHLCDYLIACGNVVIALDNLSTGSRQNIAPLIKHSNFKFIKADVVDFPFLSHFRALKLSEIYHLASPASPIHYQKDPIATFKANVFGTMNLLELAKKHRAKFLFASSSEVYGDPLERLQRESYWGNVNPVGIRSCYDESKRAGETLCMDFMRQNGTKVKIVRIFNTYGPRMDKNDGRVVSNFIAQALEGRPLTVYGRGRQTRSFQYIDDLILGLVKMMGKKGFAGPVNLGSPKEFTVLDLAKKVIKLTNSKSSIVYRALPEDDPKQRKPAVGLAQKVLKWRPKIKLFEGLTKTISYYRNGK